MFRAKTCFILGAGASFEAGFPIGSALLSSIRERLNLRYDIGNHLTSGDTVISQVFLQKSGGRYGEEFMKLLKAGRHIAEAAQIGLSIDNVIEQHDDDELVKFCGKLAIVVSLLQAERISKLMSVDISAAGDLSVMNNTWYAKFIQMLCEGVPRRNIERLFDNVSVVSFNYDRSLEYYIPLELMRVYGIDSATAESVAGRLQIVHPYGRVAELATNNQGEGVAYGATQIDYIKVASNIITFSERIEDADQLSAIRTPVDDAEQIVFLGSAFHRQNLDLITPNYVDERRIYATVMGISPIEQGVVRRELASRFHPIGGQHQGCMFEDNTCASLLQQNWRGLTSELA